MSGDHNMYQKGKSYLDDFECPRCGHCCQVDGQEPVAWMYVNKDGECEQIEYGPILDDPGVTPLYTAPPKRKWVGLTEAERVDIIDIEITQPNDDHFALAQSIEAMLREKNA